MVSVFIELLHTKPPMNFAEKKTVTFKCPSPALEFMQNMMEEKGIDRTSIIKLALYMFDGFMQDEEVRKLNLYELVERIEELAPKNQCSYCDFCEPPNNY